MGTEAARGKVGQWLPLLLILCVALSLRLLVLAGWAATPLYHSPQGDEKNFHETALAIVEGKPADAFLYQPLYSYFLAGLYWLFGPSVSVARHVQLLLGLAGVLIFYFLGRELALGMGRSKELWAGRISASIAACYAPLLVFEAQLLATPLVCWLTAAGFWLLLAAGKRHIPWLYLPAGILLGLAVMGRPNLAIVALPALAWAWHRTEGRPNKLTGCILFLIGCMVGVAPSWIHNARAGMWWVPVSSSAGHSFFIGNNPDATGGYHVPRQYPIDASSHESYRRSLTLLAEKESGRRLTPSQVSAFWFAKGLEFWRSRPLKALSLTGWKTILLLNAQPPPIHHPLRFASQIVPLLKWLPGFAFVFSFALVALLFTWPGIFGPRLMKLSSVLYGAGVVAFYVVDRYRLPLLVFLAPMAALGCIRLYEAARAGKRRFLHCLWLVAVGVAVSLVPVTSEVQIRKQLTDGYNAMGNAAMDMGDLSAAKHWYRKAIEAAGPEHGADPRTNLAMLFEREGQLENAEQLYLQAARMNPRAKLCRRRLALLYERQGRTREAMRWWTELVALEADPQPILKRIHELSRKSGPAGNDSK
ncbi:MAG: hypothetical protein D6806_11660 [Deltaproteobacteria bacterium]|nr:MAG: hypothetical protein D6806_11660 [Deltaproteobacteria bacterium]